MSRRNIKHFRKADYALTENKRMSLFIKSLNLEISRLQLENERLKTELVSMDAALSGEKSVETYKARLLARCMARIAENLWASSPVQEHYIVEMLEAELGAFIRRRYPFTSPPNAVDYEELERRLITSSEWLQIESVTDEADK